MFKLVKAEDENLLEEIYRLRYHVLCEEIKTLDKKDYPEGLEYDEYDRFADQYAILDKEGKVAGCLRLVHHSPIGFPTLNVMHMTDFLQKIDGERLGEISRITIHPKYRKLSLTKKIFNLIIYNGCPEMKNLGLDYALCAVEEPLFRLLRMFSIPFEKIGEAHEYLLRYRYPALLEMKELAKAHPKLCRFKENAASE
ncbi:acyl-homoserine-lactone synthase [Hydrogenimonas cancrithermarum]|uniref:N-acetyltransferase domain-containing protein n=1 Tax=Hydrogenimonas cancrithermarum TaxID=2993563 RepID=A0ABM8FJJ6_9BACT|nr:GNAT family N-acetyltransferase [Hydrogenimonas cancrithermarum]BDY11797.1 hypothetical protein HCR_01090 [Hydrogenimonas cancrithermarum]